VPAPEGIVRGALGIGMQDLQRRAVVYFASDDSRYVIGTTALIDLGARQIS
jgi:hypothetical protein